MVRFAAIVGGFQRARIAVAADITPEKQAMSVWTSKDTPLGVLTFFVRFARDNDSPRNFRHPVWQEFLYNTPV